MKKFTIILPLLIIVIAGGFFIAMKDQNYSATDLLKNGNFNPDFNADNPSVTVKRLDFDTEDIFIDIEIPEETQHELIKAFENARFEKRTIDVGDYDYRIIISLNTGYPMYLISDKKLLTIIKQDGQFEHYSIVNDNDFFSILEKATK